jgi:hypothetical protein
MSDITPMWQYLVWAMEGRGVMSTQSIYRHVKDWCARFERPLPDNWEAEIRQTLQANCASRPQYKGRADLFTFHKRGYWSCKAVSASIDEIAAQISN